MGVAEAVKNAGRFVTEAGAQIIKIEAGEPYLNVIKAVSDAGMAVMAHIGIRPQTIGRLGRLKAERWNLSPLANRWFSRAPVLCWSKGLPPRWPKLLRKGPRSR
ncbi:MAG: 3-methyl-2-oxobutanoate hydroxymethyltransferase [Planctomycetota bacterium]